MKGTIGSVLELFRISKSHQPTDVGAGNVAAGVEVDADKLSES